MEQITLVYGAYEHKFSSYDDVKSYLINNWADMKEVEYALKSAKESNHKHINFGTNGTFIFSE